MRMNALYRMLRKQHRDVGVTPALRSAFEGYAEINEERAQSVGDLAESLVRQHPDWTLISIRRTPDNAISVDIETA